MEERKISKKELCMQLREELKTVKHQLKLANTEKDMAAALEGLDALMENANKAVSAEVKELEGSMRKTLCALYGLKLHDNTRKAVDESLVEMLSVMDEIIAKEEEKERRESYKKFFQLLFECSDEIYDILKSKGHDIPVMFKTDGVTAENVKTQKTNVNGDICSSTK